MHLFCHFGGTNWAPKGPGGRAQVVGKISRRHLKSSWLLAPGWPQDCPKMTKDWPKMPQDGPKMAQDGSKTAQDGPKMGQDGSQMVAETDIQSEDWHFKRQWQEAGKPL